MFNLPDIRSEDGVSYEKKSRNFPGLTVSGSIMKISVFCLVTGKLISEIRFLYRQRGNDNIVCLESRVKENWLSDDEGR